jgi:hypothetical protein
MLNSYMRKLSKCGFLLTFALCKNDDMRNTFIAKMWAKYKRIYCSIAMRWKV